MQDLPDGVGEAVVLELPAGERVVMAAGASASTITSSSHSRIRTRAEIRRRPVSAVGAGAVVVARPVVSGALAAVTVVTR